MQLKTNAYYSLLYNLQFLLFFCGISCLLSFIIFWTYCVKFNQIDSRLKKFTLKTSMFCLYTFFLIYS